MAYLENGSTHRSMFRLMPPQHHDADPNRSQVLAHIMENTGWDIGRSLAAFNSMRHPKCRVLVFDREHRMWKGCDWTPEDRAASEQMVLSELRVWQRRVMLLDADFRRAEKDIEWLKRKLKAKKAEDAGPNESEPPSSGATMENLVAQAWS